MLKQFSYTLLASALIFGLTACGEQGAQTAQAATAETASADAPAPAVSNATDTSKVPVAIGSMFGDRFAQDIKEMEALGFAIDKKALSDAFLAAINGKAQMSNEDAQKVLQDFQSKLQQAQMAKMKKEAEENKVIGEKFLAENSKKEGVVTTASGLQYKILTEGKGDKPQATDTIRVNYVGKNLQDEVFDKSSEPVEFPLNGVIKGWTEAFQLFGTGTKAVLYIPAELAYGEHSPSPKIKANSVLVFEVEFLDIVKPEAKKAEEAKKEEVKKTEEAKQ